MDPRVVHLVIVVVSFTALCLVIRLVLLVFERGRRVRLESAAAQMGLEYAPKLHGRLRDVRSRLPLFWYGGRARARNLLHGRIEDLEVFLFDYQFTVDFGTVSLDDAEASRIQAQTVVVIELPEETLPDFELRPRKDFLRKARVRKGYREVALAEHTPFAEDWLVRGPNDDAIRSVITDDLIAYLQQSSGLCLDVGGRWIAVYRARHRVKAAQLLDLLEDAISVCNLLTSD